MFTVEIRINGSLLIHVYGHNAHVYGNNTGRRDVDGLSLYNYVICRTESGKIASGVVEHRHNDGIEALIVKIMAKCPDSGILADDMVKEDEPGS